MPGQKDLSMTRAGVAIFAMVLTVSFAGLAQDGKVEPPVLQQPGPSRVRVSQGVSQGLLIKKVPPSYPDEAHKKHIQGTVLLKAVINRDGDVQDLTLISGDPMLAPAALDAVKQWKYRPLPAARAFRRSGDADPDQLHAGR
jgi:TonB family protein